MSVQVPDSCIDSRIDSRLDSSMRRLRQPIPSVILKSDADQLASGSDPRLIEQLLHYGLNGTFRDLQSNRNFLVRKTLEHALQHSPLTVTERLRNLPLIRLLVGPADYSPNSSRIEPKLSFADLSDRFHQLSRWAVFQKYSGRSILKSEERAYITHSSSHHQNVTLESSLF